MKLLQPNLLTWCRDGGWDDECKPWDGAWWNPYFLPTNPDSLFLVYNMWALCWHLDQTLIFTTTNIMSTLAGEVPS